MDTAIIDKFAGVGTLDELYATLGHLNLNGGWHIPEPQMYPEPKKNFLPAQWRYEEAKAGIDAASRLIGTDLAERRNLILVNPVEGNIYGTTRTLVSAYQMLMPGERARWHRHSANALRLILDGDPKMYTIVDGKRIPMVTGDVLLTPNWSWHGHGNDSAKNAYWLDFLDIPLMHLLEGMFFEPYPDEQNDDLPDTLDSPWVFPWAETEKRLAAASPDSAGHYGRQVQLGDPAMQTIALYMMALDRNQETEQLRTTANNLYAVVSGSGVTTIDGQRFDWEFGDVFAAPAWRPHSHHASEDAVLFRVTDEPVHRGLGLLRVAD